MLSGGHLEELFDQPDLRSNVIAPDTPNLSFPDHIHRLISLDRSTGCVEFSETLLGVDPAFDEAMILLDDIVQVLDGSMPTKAAKRPFLLYSQDGRGVDPRLIRVDDARLRMRQIAQSLAKQPLGSIGIAERRQQEINRGSGRVDRSIQVTPAALHPNVGLVDTPGFVGRLEMAAQPLFQFRTVPLHPSPYRGVVDAQTAFGEQLFDIS